jgi:uridine kinase
VSNERSTRNPSLEALRSKLAVTAPLLGPTRLALVDGPAGSGKTTLANRLAAVLGCRVVHGDDLYEGWDGLDTLQDTLGTLVLEPLSRGEAARFRRWDWETGARGEWVEVPLADALVIEGVGVASRWARPYAGLVVYVDAPWEVRVARGIARDGEAMRAEWERWQAAEAPLLAAEGTREAADVVIDGTQPVPD